MQLESKYKPSGQIEIGLVPSVFKYPKSVGVLVKDDSKGKGTGTVASVIKDFCIGFYEGITGKYGHFDVAKYQMRMAKETSAWNNWVFKQRCRRNPYRYADLDIIQFLFGNDKNV